jgi:hypothetical protein
MDQNISTTIILVASVIIFFSFTSSSYVSVQSLSEQYEKVKEIAQEAQKLTEIEIEKRRDYDELVKYEDDFENMIPLGRDDARTMMIINSMANTQGIVIEDVSINDGTYGQKSRRRTEESEFEMNTKTVTLYFDTSYEKFTKFLTSLEKSRRVFDVVSINFSSVAPGQNIYNFEIAIQSYWIEN